VAGMSALDPYRSAVHYDLEFAHRVEDLRHYLRLAQRCGGPVLELGCGNGRVTLPMARAGVAMHGVDNSADMLADLKRRLQAESDAVRARTQVRLQDFRELTGPAQYPLALLPFNTLLHCHDHRDVLRLLHGVRSCLLPGGLFALDIYRPTPDLHGPAPDVAERQHIDPSSGETVRSFQQSRYDPLTQINRVQYTFLHADGEQHEVTLELRMFYPQELRALLDWAGFDIVQQASDFQGTAVSATSARWVALLKPR
jgi:SAM-dependent methyltransferase